ncbi:hypothetical protein FDH00_gp70 [Gordonia phage Attis]|uniref:Uncharacterized protein n=2 Tax=Attisvirus attis TaxID=2169707 RepID=A0A142K8W2_9CAUD|nr:hypothetical protein SEA_SOILASSASSIN_70 [Gordonia phage SoilAssassin]YP_009595828.1 hypothetical protein FDH00_gp70 [Gordonia phage Attis]AMS02471.1 hypothetical protein SEA_SOILASSASSIN_70 [Gordonia phage SoilAssassin]AMS02545.1 hypothetical protein SEA_ATTIS_70 [Gordonia phage Attis]UXE04733.1 hypothetical protein SEA_NETTUNO_68 [Gordonia phage Nettuno]
MVSCACATVGSDARSRLSFPGSGLRESRTAMAVVEIVATRLIMIVVIPAAWIQARQMRKANGKRVGRKARDDCGCGVCGFVDLLTDIDLD